MTTSTASVLVLNHDGREHLATCLPSLERQTYPNESFEVVVVDNGSTDGSVEYVRARHPAVRVIPLRRNLGFAAAYNRAVTEVDHDWVALLNNDTRVESTWLEELVTTGRRHGAGAVASKILDWDGSRVDFVGALVSVIGHSWQIDHGEPPSARHDAERELLFACGGSMLVRRDTFLDAGGFDEDLVAYFEDVDLGWRLALRGHRTVFAPKAVTYHRLHGTWGRWAFAPRLRLYERNALMMIYKNYEAATLERVLPVAIALSLARGLAHSPIDVSWFQPGQRHDADCAISPRTVAHLIALEDFGRLLPVLAGKRADIQRTRVRSDGELFGLFGEPLRLHETGTSYERVAHALFGTFGVRELVGKGPGAPPSVPVAAGPDSRTRPAPGHDSPPLVSVVVLTTLGATHLHDCLSSLQAQGYPAGAREVIVVDNASTDDPTEAARRAYPGARVIRNATNVGFSAGNNVGARAARGTYVVFLNDDTRVHPECLTELVGTATRRGAAAVGACILDWSGEHLDFAGGSINFHGKGFQLAFGGDRRDGLTEERPLLFGCGAALLVHRDLFLQAGGWDEGLFAYYEDLEIGWRLWLLGHEVWFSPHAVVYHRHHGTWGRWAAPPRVRLYERNSLRILLTHLEDRNLARILPAALLSAMDRALLGSQLGRVSGERLTGRRSRRQQLMARLHPRAIYTRLRHALGMRGARRTLSLAGNLKAVGVRGIVGSLKGVAVETLVHPFSRSNPRSDYFIECGSQPPEFDDRREPVSAPAAATLLGIREFLDAMPELAERRARLQRERRSSDAAILGQFDEHWLSPSSAPRQPEHDELHRVLIEAFGLSDIVRNETAASSGA